LLSRTGLWPQRELKMCELKVQLLSVGWALACLGACKALAPSGALQVRLLPGGLPDSCFWRLRATSS